MSERWQSELAELLADELLECCTSDCLSEEGIREIIERRKLTPYYNNRVNNYQFFRVACCNEKTTEGIIKYLLKYFPVAASIADDEGQFPLTYACSSNDVPLDVIQLLIDAAPDSVRCEDNGGNMPIHYLCASTDLDKSRASEILKLFLEKCPESIQHKSNEGHLPIHIAAMMLNSPQFLSILIEAYPGSEKMTDHTGMLPIHCACTHNTVDIVEYLYRGYPKAIVHTTTEGMHPIHLAVASTSFRHKNHLEAVDVVKFLLGCDPSVKFQEYQELPLLVWACLLEYNDTNIAAGLEIIELIHGAHPEFISEEDSDGDLPLHNVCYSRQFEGKAAMTILKLLLKKCPESICQANNKGELPIHIASSESKSQDFCRLLIEVYPGSERMTSLDGMLPIHYACKGGRVATVEYLYNLYPDGINHAASGRKGMYPINSAISFMTQREGADQEDAVDIVKFLLGCDPRVKLQKCLRALSLLIWACFQKYNDENIGSALEIIKAIYDAHPQAIETDSMNISIARFNMHAQAQAFINNELVYSRRARDSRMMTTPDHNGQLPLHAALRNNVRLGSIKLLVKGYPPAVQSPDTSGALPLHIACMHHESTSVVQYLVELDTTALEAVDEENNAALHYACRGAKYKTVKLLLEKYDAISVSKRNAHKKLPLDLLWESDEVIDRASIEYTEVVFQLVKAYPETVMNGLKAACPVQNGNEKKRKFGVEC